MVIKKFKRAAAMLLVIEASKFLDGRRKLLLLPAKKESFSLHISYINDK
jgi:hypothetical protein